MKRLSRVELVLLLRHKWKTRPVSGACIVTEDEYVLGYAGTNAGHAQDPELVQDSTPD